MRDADVRAAVRQMLDAYHASDAQTRIVEEMGIWSGAVRIDVAVINGEMSGYEIKSDRDTFDRLPYQAGIYSRVFDRVTLVVGKRHAEKAPVFVPDWWGVTVAELRCGSVHLTTVREPQRNPTPEPYLIAQLLWKEEALAILDRLGLARGWRSKRVKQIHERLASHLPIEILSAQVRETLRRRIDWLGEERSRQLDMAVHS
jgi:hypothetical protein